MTRRREVASSHEQLIHPVPFPLEGFHPADDSAREAAASQHLRELKNRLSEYVRDVRSGEGVLVTDRREVVAELIPPRQPIDEHGVPSPLVALARRGQLTLG